MMDSREAEQQLSRILDELDKLVSEMKAQAEIPKAMHNELHTDLVLNQNNPNQAVILMNGEGAIQDAITLMRLHHTMYSAHIGLPWKENTKHIRNPFKENN